jgi:hypothetical protein
LSNAKDRVVPTSSYRLELSRTLLDVATTWREGFGGATALLHALHSSFSGFVISHMQHMHRTAFGSAQLRGTGLCDALRVALHIHCIVRLVLLRLSTRFTGSAASLALRVVVYVPHSSS